MPGDRAADLDPGPLSSGPIITQGRLGGSVALPLPLELLLSIQRAGRGAVLGISDGVDPAANYGSSDEGSWESDDGEDTERCSQGKHTDSAPEERNKVSLRPLECQSSQN